MLVPKRPCPNCPWRKDVPPGEFPRQRYELLRATSPDEDGIGPGMGDPMFACHKSTEGKDYVCAGWLATQGHRHPGVRLNVIRGAFPACALEPGEGWPELFDNYEEMKSTQEGE